MKFRNLFPALLCLLAVTACNDESTITPKPQPYENLVKQISYFTPGYARTLAFRYDDQQQVTSYAEVTSSGGPIRYDTYEIIRNGGQIRIELQSHSTTTPFTATLGDNGFIRMLSNEFEGKIYTTNYSYNNNGYLYLVTDQDGTRFEYQYLLSGEWCNLQKITRYDSSDADSPSEQAKAVFTVTFEYGTIENKTSIDFGYLLRQRFDESRLFLSCCNLTGKRSSNLPVALHCINSDQTEFTIKYTYKTDEKGRVYQINEDYINYEYPEFTYDILY